MVSVGIIRFSAFSLISFENIVKPTWKRIRQIQMIIGFSIFCQKDAWKYWNSESKVIRGVIS